MPTPFIAIDYPGIEIDGPCLVVIRDESHPCYGTWFGTVRDFYTGDTKGPEIIVTAQITGGPVVNESPDPDAGTVDIEDTEYEVLPVHPALIAALLRIRELEAEMRTNAPVRAAVLPQSSHTVIGLAVQRTPVLPAAGRTMEWEPGSGAPLQLGLPLKIAPRVPVVVHSVQRPSAERAPDVAALRAAGLVTSRTLVGGYSGEE